MEGGGGRYSTNQGQLNIENYSCHDEREGKGMVGKTGREARAFFFFFFQAKRERKKEMKSEGVEKGEEEREARIV